MADPQGRGVETTLLFEAEYADADGEIKELLDALIPEIARDPLPGSFGIQVQRVEHPRPRIYERAKGPVIVSYFVPLDDDLPLVLLHAIWP